MLLCGTAVCTPIPSCAAQAATATKTTTEGRAVTTETAAESAAATSKAADRVAASKAATTPVTKGVAAGSLAAEIAADPVTVFAEKQAGYAGFRIPAIVRTADGALVAFAEARRRDKHDSGDIDLVMRRSEDGGRTWGPLEVVWDDGENTCGNPAPAVLGRRGEVVMLATWNRGGDREREIERGAGLDTRRVFVLRSGDHGRTWSTPEEITSDVKDPAWTWYATGPCHAIVKQRPPHRGRIVVPANHKRLDAAGEVECRSHLLYSDDRGRTWQRGEVSQRGGNESSVAELADGSLLLNMRHTERGDSLRLWARSDDGGASWSAQGTHADLPEPRCQGSMLNLTRTERPSRTLLFSNPHDARKRRNLSLCVSGNDGISWRHLLTVCPGPAAYSDLVRLDREHVGILYENGDAGELYRRISFVPVRVAPLAVPRAKKRGCPTILQK